MITTAKQKYLHNLQLFFNLTPRAKYRAIVLQKRRVMSKAIKFLTRSFSIQAKNKTNENVTQIF